MSATGREKPAPAEADAQGAADQEQAGEDEQEAVHDPLRLARVGAEIGGQRRERDVEDRVVDGDDQEAGGQHGQRLPAACVRFSLGRHGSSFVTGGGRASTTLAAAARAGI